MTNSNTFLMVKRGVVQYVVLRPVIGILIVALRLLGVYDEGYIAWNSGYMWVSIFYNSSICIALYFLVLFYMQAKLDLEPYRPLPKFICVKSLVFFTFWQGLLIGLVMWIINYDESVKRTAAQSIQDTLLCLEMPLFAWMHYHAFPWTDFEDTRLSSRLLFTYAVRDAIGVKDILFDTRTTFSNIFFDFSPIEDGQEDEETIPILSSNQRYTSESAERTKSVTFEICSEEERDYAQSRQLLFGDHEYPVVHSDFRNPPIVQNAVDQFRDSFYSRVNSSVPVLEWDD